ncbi:acyl-CoA thioester hydrolase/BAAT C-terminal domain-containing protein [Kutzneria sp. NPDC052558]|uniref:acyl-CoA thioester hydrolase/BAAT C-terminal domain-containing protein n=1 Tax=Kutzneria sp. NPDC052558 TaxID=3364121 RepID=UPI0037C79E51
MTESLLLTQPVSAPGVLLLGGAEGGLHERDARALHAEGYNVLALAYFGLPSLPPGLVEIPLEYFFAAVDKIASLSTGRIGVVGGSRGGEAALLIGAHDRRVGAVVSVAGGGLLTQGVDYRAGGLLDILDTPAASWTLRRKPLDYLPYQVRDELREQVAQGEPVRLRLAFPDVPADVARYRIPVERIDGPVLMLCGSDDQNWPSVAYSQAAADGADNVELRIYEGAGHPLNGPPGQPYTDTLSPGPGVLFEMGGTPEVNTKARAAAWSATLEFLQENTGITR